jgi:ATP-dependent Clp protease ATP-binding subunit ClpX
MEKDIEKPEQANTKTKLPLDPETIQQEFQEMVKKKFGGQVQVLSMDDGFPGAGFDPGDDLEEETSKKEIQQSIQDFSYKPKDIKKHLDRFVIGQDQAKQALAIAVCDHYNHLRHELNTEADSSHYQKQNVLILGPTGVGKTYLVRLISDLIGVPFVKADATRFSEVGYMGANVDDIIRDLVQVAGGDKELASQGIVYVDEVDKLASRRDHTGRDVSGRGVQFGFLRLLENSDVDLNASHDMASQFKTFMSFQRKGKVEKDVVNTKNILFIFSGAFHGLEEIINKRVEHKSIGLHSTSKGLEMDEALKKVESKDLVNFGFEHEFIGRLPIRVSCESLSPQDLYQILTSSEHSIIKQYKESFAHYGIQLSFTDKALKMISERAYEQKTGARGLVAVIESLLRPFKFEMPSTGVKVLEVNEELVNNPMGALHMLIQS